MSSVVILALCFLLFCLYLSFWLRPTGWMNRKINKLEGYSRSHPRNGRDLGAWVSMGQTWGSMGSFEEKSRAPCGSQQVGPALPHPHPSTTVQLECQPRHHALKPLNHDSSWNCPAIALTISGYIRRFHCNSLPPMNYNAGGGRESFVYLFCMYECGHLMSVSDSSFLNVWAYCVVFLGYSLVFFCSANDGLGLRIYLQAFWTLDLM